MREIEVSMLIDTGDESDEYVFTYEVNDDWVNTAENRLEIYEFFRRDSCLDIETITDEEGNEIEEGATFAPVDEEE